MTEARTPPKVAKSDRDWQQELTPEQYRVTRCQGTERPFTGPYWDEKAAGTYACICCGTPLFSSREKYDSGSGWPSYWAPIAEDSVTEHEDLSHGMRRVEARCATCDAHLGHVFPDGPPPTGLRYCINGHALRFDPQDA